MPNNYIYFGLTGEFDPTEVAQEIDLAPMRSAGKHSKNPEKRIPRCSIMRFAQTDADQNEEVLDVHALADRLVEQLEPYAEQFASAIKKHDAKATLHVVFSFPVSEEVSTPILGFSNRVIRFLTSTGATIDMDSYRE